VFPTLTALLALGVALGAAKVLDLTAGSAAGLFAGLTTQSAVVGTASQALSDLGLPPEQLQAQQEDLSSVFSLTYLVSVITVVLWVSQIAPALMRADLAKDAAELLQGSKGAEPHVQGGSVAALPDLVGRVYRVGRHHGQTAQALQRKLGSGVIIYAVDHGNNQLPSSPTVLLGRDDLVHLVGRRAAILRAEEWLGAEVAAPPHFSTSLVIARVMVTRRAVRAYRRVLRERNPSLGRMEQQTRGVVFTHLTRGAIDLPLERNVSTEIQPGDVIDLVGDASTTTDACRRLGQQIDPTIRFDFTYIAGGVALGVFVGLGHVDVLSIPLTLGTGGGALLTGLLFGWLRTKRATVGAYDSAAAEVVRDLGLTIFVAGIGLTAAPQILPLLGEYGAGLPLLAVLGVLAPGWVSLLVARRFFKLPSPVVAGLLAGQFSSSPGIAAVIRQAGNSTPMNSYVTVYALSNLLYPVFGPLVVGLVASNT